MRVSVPYWGSNYLIETIGYYAMFELVSVPYWGSNYLIINKGIASFVWIAFPSPTGVLII